MFFLLRGLFAHVIVCIVIIRFLYNSKINVRALIGQSARGYCAGKPKEKSRVF